MKYDMMLDLETLGTKPGAAIVQIGACFFDRNSGAILEAFQRNVSIQSNFDIGLIAEANTLNWWLNKQDITWLTNPSSIIMALTSLAAFIKGRKVTVWSHSAFDIPILNIAYTNTALRIPFDFRSTCDLRTLVALSGIDYKNEQKYPKPNAHDALSDCEYQISYLVDCLKSLDKL